MDRRVLKYNVAAALFSAAFLFGVSPADAYTYSGGTVTVDQVAEDENDLVVTGGANITSNGIVNPQIIKNVIETQQTTLETIGVKQLNTGGAWGFAYTIENLPQNIDNNIAEEIKQAFKNIAIKTNSITNKVGTKDGKVSTSGFEEINKKYNLNIGYIAYAGYNSSWINSAGDLGITIREGIDCSVGFNFELKYNNGKWYFDTTKIYENYGNVNENALNSSSLVPSADPISNTTSTITVSERKKLGDTQITVSNKSTLLSKGNIKTSKAINVTGDSYLKVAGSVTGGDVYSDKAIISTTNDQGESIITPGNITATGALKSDTYIGAWSGAVSGKTVYSGGDVVSDNSIKAGGLAKGKVLNVAAINAASASITGNQSISGVFTAAGQAKLNGGAALGNKKISSLSAGTLSTTSTDAVNGAQLNTIKQKLATAGKTYSAGSDVAITAANAISVTKNGAIDKGNTGIVTGGAVYKITSALNQSLDLLKASVSSHQSTLNTLSQGLSDLKSSVTNINSSVASATKNLSAQLTNRLQSDLGNLSDDGKNVIRNMVSSTLKSMSSMSISDAGKSASAIATYEAANDVEDDSLADIRTGLDSKVTRGDFDLVSTTVASNTKSVDFNSSAIQKNVGDIAELKVSKADVDGGDISVDGYAKRLGVGKVEDGNAGLVTGDTVYAALDKKADYGYVAGGLGMVSSELDAMSQRMTSDLNRVGAGASALAGLHPTGYDASDKLSFAYGGGHYKNANTSALGAFYHPNDKTLVSLAGTIGNADAMLSAGISIKVGMRDHVSKVIVTPKMFSAQEVSNQDMKDHLDTQAERIRQIELALQNR